MRECLLHKLQDYYLFAPLWAAYWNGTVMAGSGTGAIVLSFAGYNAQEDGTMVIITGDRKFAQYGVRMIG